MSTNTTNMAMGKAVDGDNARTYLETTLGAALDTVDAHDHSNNTTKGLFPTRLANSVGLGIAADTSRGIYVASTALTGSSEFGITSNPTGSSSGTSEVSSFVGLPTTAASTTTTTVAVFHANNPAKGAASTITTAYGLFVDPISIGATNFGVYAVGTECALGKGSMGNGDTVGFLDIPSGGGSPTGVPAVVPSGLVAMRYDTSLHKLWIYDGGWKGVVLS